VPSPGGDGTAKTKEALEKLRLGEAKNESVLTTLAAQPRFIGLVSRGIQ